MFKRILIPTDGSSLSRRAIAVGVKLAKSLGASVVGVFAAPPATPVIYKSYLPVGYASPTDHAKLIQKTAAQYLAVIEETAKKSGVPCDSLHVSSDYPADVILNVAGKKNCDLIVMASHGRKGLRGALLGSQAQKVLSGSKTPVLICR